MQTHLADWIRATPEAEEAEAILRKCVHCGFCTASCPTYQLLGDELDGPRGRIYLIKQMMEGAEVTRRTRLHLDRCLGCRGCETACPSGVRYGRLADIGRSVLGARVPRPLGQRWVRRVMAAVLRRRGVFRVALGLGRLLLPLRAVLPRGLAGRIPGSTPDAGVWPAPRHARRMIVLAGCVQPALAPDTNAAAARVLDRLGISLIEAPSAGCCGALRYHLDFQAGGLDDMRALIDAWWPLIESGAEAIVMTASGCGATVREYGELLARDPRYADKAARVSAMCRDLAEVVASELPALSVLCQAADARGAARGNGVDVAGRSPEKPRASRRIAFHAPCTLQHGQPLQGVTERVLTAAGFELVPVTDAHLCCGSAGTYSLLQPVLSERLRRNKLDALISGAPGEILTANIGCQTHLAAGGATPVRHWIVALEERLM